MITQTSCSRTCNDLPRFSPRFSDYLPLVGTVSGDHDQELGPTASYPSPQVLEHPTVLHIL